MAFWFVRASIALINCPHNTIEHEMFSGFHFLPHHNLNASVDVLCVCVCSGKLVSQTKSISAPPGIVGVCICSLVGILKTKAYTAKESQKRAREMFFSPKREQERERPCDRVCVTSRRDNYCCTLQQVCSRLRARVQGVAPTWFNFFVLVASRSSCRIIVVCVLYRLRRAPASTE